MSKKVWKEETRHMEDKKTRHMIPLTLTKAQIKTAGRIIKDTVGLYKLNECS